jgi:chromate transporter
LLKTVKREAVRRVKKYISLFLTMLKIGLFTFGGGYAMIALLEHELVEKKRWLEKDEFLDMTAVAESTPGPIAVNMATFLGYKRGGIFGAAAATLGVCLPSFVIIFVISLVFDAFLALKPVFWAFRGVQVGVVFLILSAGLRMLQGLKKTPLNVIAVAAVAVLMTVFSLLAVKFSAVFYILICGAAGVFLYLVRRARAGKDGAA